MVIIEVTFDELYPTAPFLNTRIGAKASVSEREDPQEAWSQLKRLADDFHKKNYPNMYVVDQQKSVPQQLPETMVDRHSGLPEKESLLKQISEITDLKVLQSFRILKDKYKEVADAYSKREKELK